jgi:hypothetical protein
MHKRERLIADHAKHRAAEEAKLRRLQASASEEASKRQARRERELEKAKEKHRKAVEKLEAKGRKERRKMEAKEEREREKEEKKAEEEERRRMRSGSSLEGEDVGKLQERVVYAETWRRVVEGRIAGVLEDADAEGKGVVEKERVKKVLEGVDSEVLAEVQRGKISAASVTSLASSVKS